MHSSIIIDQSDTVALNRFFAKIYGYVAAGIGLSALMAFLSVTVLWESVTLVVLQQRNLVMVLMLAQIGLVFFASLQAAKNSPLALPLFLLYSVSNGFTLSFILIYYTQAVVFQAFVTSALMFVVMALIGATTKKDLSGFGQALRAALWGVIIAGLVNMFLGSSGLSFALSIVSVLIFSGLIAYDNQRIRHVFDATGGHVGDGWAVSMALQLYLDFINLFLNLLRLFARRD